MVVAYFQEWPGVTREIAHGVADKIDAQLGGVRPEGELYHAEGDTEGAWWTFDVWESEDAARRFYDEMLNPAANPVSASQARIRPLRVHWHSKQAPSDVT